MKQDRQSLRFPSVNLTIKDCNRTQSSRSSYSDMAWSDSSAADCLNSPKILIAQDTLESPSALLEDYNAVFTQISALKTAVTDLIKKVSDVTHCNSKNAQDSVHNRLFCMLSEKISDLSKTVDVSGFCDFVPSIKQKRNLSLSHFKAKGVEISETTSNPATEFRCNKAKATVNILNRVSDTHSRGYTEFMTPKKRKTRFSVKSECNYTINVSTNVSVPITKIKPSDSVVSAVELRLGGDTLTEDSKSEKKLNYFDTISNLMKMNFVDHDQVVILKKCVIKKDERILRPLREYENNKDLQVLISRIGAIIESCDLFTK